MHMILRVLGTVAAVLAAAYVVPGFIIDGFYPALIVALLLGVISITLKPILMIVTLPINILTLGLFSFVVNAGILWWVASFVDGFAVTGFVPALIGGFVIAVVQWAVHRIV